MLIDVNAPDRSRPRRALCNLWLYTNFRRSVIRECCCCGRGWLACCITWHFFEEKYKRVLGVGKVSDCEYLEMESLPV